MRALLLALALVLVMAAPAYAGSADSHITTPSSPAFLIDDGGTTALITGTADFNNIDIICTYGPGRQIGCRTGGEAPSSRAAQCW